MKHRQQQGASLLLTLLVLVLGSVYWITGQWRDRQNQLIHYQASRLAMKQAHEALISYAANYHRSYQAGHYGTLPCPDLRASGEEGNQDTPCGPRHVNTIGQLPWQTLGVPPLRDGAGECLWYAVSGTFKGGNSRATMLNRDTQGMFHIHDLQGSLLQGNKPENHPAAVIFAPGSAIPGQQRQKNPSAPVCGGNYKAENYLEGATRFAFSNHLIKNEEDVIDRLITGGGPLHPDNNDLLLPVFPEEIFSAIERSGELALDLYAEATPNNLTRRIAECLAAHYKWQSSTGLKQEAGHTTTNTRPHGPLQPAPVSLPDYRWDEHYRERLHADGGIGRLPLHRQVSNTLIHTPCAQSERCWQAADFLPDLCAGQWLEQGLETTEIDRLHALWENWKDHLFYVASQPLRSDQESGNTLQCGVSVRCPQLLTEPEQYTHWAAMLIFANSRIPKGRLRHAPPFSEDGKNRIEHYLESVLTKQKAGNTAQQFIYRDAAEHYNDVLYCISDDHEAEVMPPFSAVPCPQFKEGGR